MNSPITCEREPQRPRLPRQSLPPSLPPPPRGCSAASPRCRGWTVHSSLRISVLQERRGGPGRGTRRISSPHDTLQGHGRSMLGRGVKRKWSCLEELEAEVLPGAAALDEKSQDSAAGGGDGPSVSRLQQRQLVLSLCLEKLQHYQAGVELSLRRSVLLINTLRQIQEEMRSDGSGTCPPGGDPDSYLLKEDFREDMSVTCSGCAEGDGESLSLSPPVSPEPAEQQKSPPTSGSSTFSDAGSAMGYLSDLALDDIFEDIDTSMYESSDLPSAWAAAPLWPVASSLWWEEDMKLRPLSHSSAGSLQSCLMDLNELDHIMEVLVKS
ncbi:hypothetical protein OJAV_G00106400 [Oryzias javanicus]|uniref:SERTA domain-containing protein n=1 Tax=Oryzias javanicus TaxID=123683 RepID=A0A3S2Q0G8_ORYJA|nr:hypothetical protein OJAV_G00106400 [Oryzias javanicus]